MTYKLYKTNPMLTEADGAYVNLEDGRFVCFRFDPANTDYQAYLKWVEAGNTPQAADAATEPADEQGA